MASTLTEFAHLKIPLKEVIKATDKFDAASIIWHGVFGPAYKGRLLWSENLIKIVAIRLDRKLGLGDIEFLMEISILSDLKHPNLVSLIGFCDENNEKIIVIRHEANGSLMENLNNPNLTWTQRLRISIGVARALSYLHHPEGRDYGVIHRNINSSTILLDENWEPKLSGFTFSIKQAANRMDQVFLCEPVGIFGYVDPLTENNLGVTYKSDIYSFGVVLYEIFSGREAFTPEDGLLVPLVKYHRENKALYNIIYPTIWNQMLSTHSVVEYSNVAHSCLKEDPTDRPHMKNVVGFLENALKRELHHQNLVNNLKRLRIRLSDIELATNNFLKSYQVLSSPEYSCNRVEFDYFDIENPSSTEMNIKGEHRKTPKTLTLKRFHPRYDGRGEDMFYTSIQMLSSVNQRNIVTLHGFCVDGFEMVLITENFCNGYLAYHLENVEHKRILTWEKRLKICIDVAHALKYLHFEMDDQKVIIHRDICSYDIWLDEEWRAKIYGFDISVFLPPNQEEADYPIHLGRPLYFDPKYAKNGKVKRELDVYSFGVVLFEILTGKTCNDPMYLKESEKGLVHVVRERFNMGTVNEMIDPLLNEENGEDKFILTKRPNKDSLNIFLEIAFRCIAENQDQRPTMKVVTKELEKALHFQEDQVHQLYIDQVVNELENSLGLDLIHENRVPQPDIDQVVKKSDKSPERESAHEKFHLKEDRVQHLDIDQTVDKHENTPEFESTHAIVNEKKLQHLKIPLSDIKLATYNFSEAYKITSMQTQYYTCYKAELNLFNIQDPSSVVIKRICPGQALYKEEDFVKEVDILTSVKHPNIVTLFGFCVEASEMILIIDNVSNGFLGDYLENNDKRRLLTWEKRLKICIDVAQALNYLHFGMEYQMMIITRDICSYNIMLDENLGAKIVAFKESALLPLDQDDEGLFYNWVGRSTYIDPEYMHTYKLKRESDVYSFGVVLFEILCGRVAFDKIYLKQDDKGLAPIARQSLSTGRLDDMIDIILMKETGESNFILNRGPNKDSLRTFIQLAYQCIAETQNQRPTMEVVVKQLKKALFFQEYNKDSRKISLETIKGATQNFDAHNYIGGGGFGKVYKGHLQNGDVVNTIVAKRLNTGFAQREQQFLTELQILLEYKHENVIGLVGHCDEEDEKIIVYEYASRGSLDRHLHKASLTWLDRLNICIDVASALDFLHGGVGKQAKVIHRDIKTANILLNHEWKAKLADFGLSLITPITQKTDFVIDHVCGTQGYLDPLYGKYKFLTVESDIYSFGVVLFEILCGRSTYTIHKHEGEFLPSFIKKQIEGGKINEAVFEQIKGQIVLESLTIFQEIAYQCLHHERENRPTIRKVLTQLKKALDFQNMTSTLSKLTDLQIPLEDIVKATNNFHHDNIIGHGGFGTVYIGRILRTGSLMTINAWRFNCMRVEVDLEFLKEVSVLSDLKHTNLVSLVGFCDEKAEKIIVTVYEALGSLSIYLNSPNLTWTQRLRICVGLARVLSYLGYEKGRDYAIIHCNIKSDTILLDENWEAKLSGFSISIKQSVGYKGQVCLWQHTDTRGYRDPAIEKTGGVTQKSDIYSFGVVLFELLCGMKAFVENDVNWFLSQLAKYHYEKKTLHDVIYQDLVMSPQSLLIYSDLAYSCINDDRECRPKLKYIVAKLEKALEFQHRFENIEKNLKHLKIRLGNIKLVTDNFSDTYKIASTEYYSCYKAELNPFDKKNSLSVVIKRISSQQHLYQEEHFVKEIEVCSRVKHPNIVTLFGFCVEASEMILVFDNVPSEYLGLDYLGNANRMRILTWEKRLKICIDVAHALNYLHSKMEEQNMIINYVIHSYNLGLDKKGGAKIANFIGSVYRPQNHEDVALDFHSMGRFYEADATYNKTLDLKRESDVYAFGVLLFEILCGRTADDPDYLQKTDKGAACAARQSFFKGTTEEMTYPIIKEETNKTNFALSRGPNSDSLRTFIKLAHQCTVKTQDQNLTMNVVVKELEKALLYQENEHNPKFPLEDIKLATRNFHEDNCIGREGSGKTYIGNLQVGDRVDTIVSKRLDDKRRFLSELQILWEFKHKSVVGLVGYCDEHDEKIIVYEYASRRSLDRYLNDASFSWMKRLNICIDIASALDFIHGGVGNQAKVIHGDIKSSSILVYDDWRAKLADFGFSLISPITHETECVIDYACGTPGYMDPLHRKTGFLTVESDIYSFGVVLFEMLCGRSTFEVHEQEGHYIPDFIKKMFGEGKHEEVVFKQIKEQIDQTSLTIFQEIAYHCLHHEREKRPTIKEVLRELNKALEFQVTTSLSSNQGFQTRTSRAGRTGQIVNRRFHLNGCGF